MAREGLLTATAHVKGVASLKGLPTAIRRAVVLTNTQAAAPKGWREVGGGMHLGRGRWLLTFEREDDA